MSQVLKELYNYRVFKYFEEISCIPRASGDRKGIADYCVNFAKEHNLEYIRDEFDNVIITKEATKGYENHDIVIIQGHLDMVAEKEVGSTHDFSSEPIKLILEGDFISADKTTLGGDDGIAVAYALAILDSDELRHPKIKAVFTADEEIGLLGAGEIDAKYLEGKYLLNIDSEEEGIFLNSCAGGETLFANIEYEMTDNLCKKTYQLTITGLLGGHSGTEINKFRANAGKLFGGLMVYLETKTNITLSSIDGGKKDNAIMRHLTATISSEEDIISAVAEYEKYILSAYSQTDSKISIKVKPIDYVEKAIDSDSYQKLIMLLSSGPNGVIHYDNLATDYVQTSCNIGILTMKPEYIEVSFSVRSSIDFIKKNVIDSLGHICKMNGIKYKTSGEYPGWAVNPNSKLIDIMKDVYVKQYGKEPKVLGVHAGLECGIFYKKNPKLDIVSFGPNLYNIHTPGEHLSISSTKRVWHFIVEVLENL